MAGRSAWGRDHHHEAAVQMCCGDLSDFAVVELVVVYRVDLDVEHQFDVQEIQASRIEGIRPFDGLKGDLRVFLVSTRMLEVRYPG